MSLPNRTTALAWMTFHADESRDPRTGEVNHTALAEACADAYDDADEGGPLDDPDHWIWEIALEVQP